MNPDNISRYLSTGSIFDEDEKTYRKNSFGPLVLTLLCGLFPSGILKGFWPFMSLAMVLVSLSCVIIVFKLSSFVLTMKDALRLDVVIFGTWIFDLGIIEQMVLICWKGFSPWTLLIYVPVVFMPLFFGVKIYKAIQKPDYNPQKNTQNKTKIPFFFYGILGMTFARIFFRNVDQGVAFVALLFCFSILNGFMSLGLLSLQNLYYMKKFKINW